MVECNSIGTPNIYPNLNDQQQFRLNEINDIKEYFVAEIKDREIMSKRLGKYTLDFFISNSFISNCTRFYKMIKQLQSW